MPRGADKSRLWQTAGNASQIGSALAAIGALAFIAWQVSQIEVNSRKANARQVYYAARPLVQALLGPGAHRLRRDPGRPGEVRALQVVRRDDDLRL